MQECAILACNFTKSNTLPWVFFTFLKLYRWYQIVKHQIIRVFNESFDVTKKQRKKKQQIAFHFQSITIERDGLY